MAPCYHAAALSTGHRCNSARHRIARPKRLFPRKMFATGGPAPDAARKCSCDSFANEHDSPAEQTSLHTDVNPQPDVAPCTDTDTDEHNQRCFSNESCEQVAASRMDTGTIVVVHPNASLPIGNASGSDQNEDSQVTWQWRRQTLGRMVKFMLPALVIPLADPLMSMVDTICIGQFGGTKELAAMGPANLAFVITQYLFLPLQTATTKIMADNLSRGRIDEAQNVMQSVLLIGAVIGTISLCIFEVLAEQIMALIGAQPILVPLSTEYLRIRAAAQPAVLTTLVAQSALLSQKDSLAPALVVTVMCAANIAGNMALVAAAGMGLVGAALTTVAAQYAGAAGLLYALKFRGQIRPGFRVPTMREVHQIFSTVGPLAIVSVAKNSTHLMIQATAAALPTIQLAAHQALFSLWTFFVMFACPIEQAGIMFSTETKQHWQKQLSVVQLLVVVAVAVGLVVGGAAAGFPSHLPSLFTRDRAVWPFLASLQIQALLSLLFAIVDISIGGLLVARGHMWHLAVSTCITLVTVVVGLQAAKTGAWGLQGVWWAQVLFYGARLLQNSTRLVVSLVTEWRKQRRSGMYGA